MKTIVQRMLVTIGESIQAVITSLGERLGIKSLGTQESMLGSAGH